MSWRETVARLLESGHTRLSPACSNLAFSSPLIAPVRADYVSRCLAPAAAIPLLNLALAASVYQPLTPLALPSLNSPAPITSVFREPSPHLPPPIKTSNDLLRSHWPHPTLVVCLVGCVLGGRYACHPSICLIVNHADSTVRRPANRHANHADLPSVFIGDRRSAAGADRPAPRTRKL